MILLQQMVILFLIMMVGFWCRRRGMLNDETSKKLSGLVVNVANPALILTAGMNKEAAIEGAELARTFLIAVGMYGVLILIAHFIPMLIRVEKKDYGTYKVMTIFSNIGFMGFPVISAVYGTEALLYASLFMLPFNALIYTYGIQVMKPVGKKKEPFHIKKVWNVGVIACLISMVIYLFRIPMPEFIEGTVSSLSSLTAPLSMIIIGDSMSKINLKKLFLNTKLLFFAGIKLLVIPLCGTLIIQGIGCSPVMAGVCMIMLATPVGSMTAMLAQQYDGDFELASKGVTLTTILSVATIPIVSMILGA